MKKILVATDFSARSDRAIRRATLLATRFGASISLIHVIDDEQPKRIIKAERAAALALLSEQAQSLREIDAVACDHRIVLGDPFQGIIEAAGESGPDLLVIGPHRRQALKDVFIGTTAERVIRASRRPVLMANSVPAGFYRQVLVAVDLSDFSGDALRTVKSLGLAEHVAVSVVHVFDAPGTGLMRRASVAEDQVEDYLVDERNRAAAELTAFLSSVDFSPIRQVLKHSETSAAHSICSAAREVSADLVVIGTHGRTGIKKLLLGSVAEEVLRIADHDVLAVPPQRVG